MAKATVLAQYDNNKGLTQKGAIDAANAKGVRILSNKEFDQRLVLSDTWKSEKEVYPAWSGTLVAFKGEGAKLGDVVEYTSQGITYILEVPKEYQNEKNAILVMNHCFIGGKALIIPSEQGTTITYEIADKSQIALLQNFPTSNGWYNANNAFGIPLGKGISSDNSDARYLYKTQNYVGLLARGYDGFGFFNRRCVGADSQPSVRFGVLVDTEAAKLAAAPKPEAAQSKRRHSR